MKTLFQQPTIALVIASGFLFSPFVNQSTAQSVLVRESQSPVVQTQMSELRIADNRYSNYAWQDGASGIDGGMQKMAEPSKDQSDKPSSDKNGTEKANSLLELPTADLHAGIVSNSLQRAIAKREIADPNLVFDTVAIAAPLNYAYGNQCYLKTWDSPNLCYHPLYFEEEGLERYGHGVGHHLQPYVSGFRFLTTVVRLPYHVTVQPLHSCESGLGYYRPGNCNPAYRDGYYISPRGAAVQAIVGAGLYAL